MCYITKKIFSNLEVNLKGHYIFIFVYLENLKVEGCCSWSLNFFFLFLKVEGSCYCSWRLKAHDLCYVKCVFAFYFFK
jgi:hypothetical protein